MFVFFQAATPKVRKESVVSRGFCLIVCNCRAPWNLYLRWKNLRIIEDSVVKKWEDLSQFICYYRCVFFFQKADPINFFVLFFSLSSINISPCLLFWMAAKYSVDGCIVYVTNHLLLGKSILLEINTLLTKFKQKHCLGTWANKQECCCFSFSS